MTKWLISTAFAGFAALSTAPALAQEQDHRGGRGADHPQAAPAQAAPAQAQAPRPQIGGRFGHGYNPNGGGAPDQRAQQDRRPSAGAQAAPQAQPAPQTALRGQGDNNNQGRGFARGQGGNNNQGRDFARGQGGNNNNNNNNRGNDFAMRNPGPNNGRGQDRAMRGPNPGAQRDFSSYHRNFNAPRHFQAGAYRRPAGWYSHRWVYGEILPSLFWAPDFWLSDYYDYGLMSPPPGTVWVRDGTDALLIDSYSGEIIQVAYGVFY